jgi:hydrogenase maturation protease
VTTWRGLVLGVGNLLLQDEGVGIHVVQAITRAAGTPGGALPEGTRVVDGGTLGLDLLPLLDDADGVVLVDAAELRREPGAVAVLRGGDLASAIAGHLSIHQVGIGDLLAVARLAGSLPEQVALVAIQPADIAPGLELSPDVAAALPAALEVVRREAWAQARAGRLSAGEPGEPTGPGESG